jgi:hypothetical protein
MTKITSEQNTERQIQRLAAQRQLYATAKKVFGVQVVLSGPVAVASAFLGIILPDLQGYVALWGIMIAICDLLLFTPWQKRLREDGARVQELFDCDVLLLPWNDLKVGKRPDPEMVKEQSEKYQKWAAKMPPLTNWYASLVGDLPLQIGRIACQRSNCWWDSAQRRRYAFWVVTSVIVAFVAVFWIALGNGFTIENFIVKVAAPLAPALLLGVRQFTEQMEAATRLDKLKEHSERLWDEALRGKPEPEITLKSRGLQDEIFENRRRSPLVFDAIYKRLQRNFEVQMNHGVAELVAEAKERLGLVIPTVGHVKGSL